MASYYAVPHLVRIATHNQLVDYNVLALVSLIEIQRHKNNPKLPGKLAPAYEKSVENLQELALITMKRDSSLNSIIAALSAIALAKGQRNLADAILKFDSEEEIDAFLENY
ncbi:MAG: hypothetical protein ACHQIM_15450 [Sphingobacteriales bacterium]